MGLTGTHSWNANSSDSTVQRYDSNGNAVGAFGYQGIWRFIMVRTNYRYNHVIFTIKTDAAGCSTLQFTCDAAREGSSNPPQVFWKIQTSKSLDTSGMTEASYNGSTWSGTISSTKMLPNTTYYIHFYSTSGSDAAHANSMHGTMTITGTGTYGEPGNITANNCNFDSPINMSYSSASPGGTYTVKVKVGSSAEVTLQTKGSASSRSWTPSLSTYGSSYPNQKTVNCLITVETWFGNTKSGERTKTVTISFTAAQAAPTTSHAFSIAPKNDSPVSGMSGYIKGYSKIRASFASGNVTRKYGATISKWTVKFGSAAAVDVAAGTSTKDSGAISANTTVTCTVTDSRGFTASETYTATITPYQKPTLEASAFRCNSEGTAAEDGTYVCVACSTVYADVASQNSMTVKAYTKLRSASAWGQPVTITGGTTTQTGTNKTYSKSGVLISGLTDAVWDVKVEATDALGNKAEIVIVIASQAWALHIRNGGSGAAFGKAAERDNELDIGSWKITCGGVSSIIKVEIASFSSLPKTIYHNAITSDHVVLRDEVGTPSAMTGEWEVNTYNGSLTISGSISGSTTLRLILGIPGTSTSG